MKIKFYSLLLFTSFICTNNFAQPTITTQKAFGGNEDDFFNCMTLTKDGGYILGGSSTSDRSGEKSENSRGLSDYWIVKLDHEGKIQWDKTIGGSKDDYLTSIRQTNDGGYILGGSSNSGKSGEKTEDNRCGCDYLSDYWVVKLDSDGKIQWDKTIGGNDMDDLNSVQKTTDGGYILGGSSYSNISGEKTENSRGNKRRPDYWVVKLDRDGKIQWDKTVGGNNFDQLYFLLQTDDGGYILQGDSFSNISGEKTENSRGSADYWVVKLNSRGKVQWDKTIGGTKNDWSNVIRKTTNGGYILGGYSESNESGEKTENSRGGYDYWVVHLNSDGKIQWDKTIGGSEDDALGALQQASDGGYVLAGDSYSNKSGEKTENSKGNNDYWVVKLNNQGKFQWDKTIGGNNNEYSFNINETGKDQYVVGGASLSGISGDKKSKSRGGYDYWLVWLSNKTGTRTSIETSENIVAASVPDAGKSLAIYPNPAKDVLHIQAEGKSTLSLTNQAGKVLFTKTIIDKGEINIAGLPAGLYFLKNNETGVAKKVILEK